jgi:hypothetical protein
MRSRGDERAARHTGIAIVTGHRDRPIAAICAAAASPAARTFGLH